MNHKMVNNCVSGCQLTANAPKADLLEIKNLKFIPGIVDHQQQRFNYIVLVLRMLVHYFDAFEPLKKTCIQHIPHKYQNEMSQKSPKVHFNGSYTVHVCRHYEFPIHGLKSHIGEIK